MTLHPALYPLHYTLYTSPLLSAHAYKKRAQKNEDGWHPHLKIQIKSF